jgi:hypothetical protein
MTDIVPTHSAQTVLRHLAAFAAALLALSTCAHAATPSRLIVQAVDDADRVRLTDARARWANDAMDGGPVPASLHVARLSMTLRRPADRQAAFDALLRDQQDPATPDFGDWWIRFLAKTPVIAMVDAEVARRRIHGRNVGIARPETRGAYVRLLKEALDRRRAGGAKP